MIALRYEWSIGIPLRPERGREGRVVDGQPIEIEQEERRPRVDVDPVERPNGLDRPESGDPLVDHSERGLPAGLDRFELRELDAADRRLELVHPVVQPEPHVGRRLRAERLAPVGEPLGSPVDLLVVRGHHPALATGIHVLSAHQAHRPDVAEWGRQAAPIRRAVRLGEVTDDREIVLAGDLADRVHVAHVSVDLTEDDCPRVRCDRGPDPVGGHEEGVEVVLGPGRDAVVPQDRHDRTRVGERRRDDLASRFQIQCPEGRVDGRRAGRDARDEADAEVLGELALVRIHLDPTVAIEPAAFGHRLAHDGYGGVDLLLVELGPDRHRGGANGGPAVDRQDARRAREGHLRVLRGGTRLTF